MLIYMYFFIGVIGVIKPFRGKACSKNNSLLERVHSRVQYIWRLRVMVSWYSTTYKIFWFNNDSNSKKIYSFGTWHWFLEEEQSNFLSEFIYLSRMAVCNQVIVVIFVMFIRFAPVCSRTIPIKKRKQIKYPPPSESKRGSEQQTSESKFFKI